MRKHMCMDPNELGTQEEIEHIRTSLVDIKERAWDEINAALKMNGAQTKSNKGTAVVWKKQYLPLGVWAKMGYPADKIQRANDVAHDPVLGPLYLSLIHISEPTRPY